VSIDTGLIGPGQSWGDPAGGGVTAGGASDTMAGTGDPETDFKTAVMQALLSQGIDITMMDPDQVDSLVQMLWNSQRLQDLFQLESDPASAGFPDITVTPTQLRSAIQKELFDPLSSSSSAAVTAGLGLLQQQNLKLDQAQQEFVVTGAGGSSDIRQIIISTASSLGVDPALALAIAQQESGLDPNAVGDGGSSIGLFQLNDQGEGYGMTVAERQDPRRNAQIALAMVAQVAAQHPDWSPGQIAAAAQRPADRAGYASAIDSLYGPIKGGKLPSTGTKTTTLKQLYPEAVAAFRSQYGRDPSATELQGLVGLNSDQIREYLRGQSSHIAGLTFGAYGDLKSTADRESNALFGHGVTDGMVKELSDEGKTSPTAVKFWFSQQDIGGKMDPKVYQGLYRLNQPHMQGIYNERGFDPRIARQQYQRAQAAGITDKQIAAHRPIPTFHEGADPLNQQDDGGGGSKMFS
jgi:hypothetical protein